GQRLRVLPTERLPVSMTELRAERLGEVSGAASDVRKLELLRTGVLAVAPGAAARDELAPAVDAAALDALRQRLSSPTLQRTFAQVVDPATVEGLLAEYMGGEVDFEFRPLLPLVDHLQDDLADFAALALVYEMCTSDLGASKLVRIYKRHPFRA